MIQKAVVALALALTAIAAAAPSAAGSSYVYQSTVVFDGCSPLGGLAVEPSGGDVWMTRCGGEYANEGPGVFTRYASGQLNQPSGITLDGSSNVYVADRGNSRIKVFSPAGALTANWLVGGQPRNLDVDASGNVYVTDTTNNKVKKYTSTGSLIGSWGTFGSGSGQFDIPQGIAVDRSSGNVYVADTHNGRIQKFDSNGNYLAQWATGAVGTGLEVDGAGNVYGIGGAGAPVEKFSSFGAPLDTIGAYGTAGDQINNPSDVAVDAAGIVYVLDAAGKVARYVQGGRVNISLDVTPGFFDNFPFATSGGLFPASFTLDNCNGGSCTTKSTAGPAGSGYSISQNLPAGWEQASATCDDGSDPSSITLSDGEVVNCHFTNRKLGTIVVKQDTQPDGEGQDFDYTPGGGLSPTTFTLDDDSDPALSNTQTFENLQPSSSYSIAQSSTPAGWNPAQVTCSDGSNPSAIDVSYGETVTCTFVNRSVDSGTITVKLDAPDSPSSLHFSFATTGFGAAAPSSFSLTNGGFPPSQVTFVVHAGSGYGVTQTSNNTGYDASASCSDGSPTSAIDVSTGEDVTCTFINQRRPVVTVALSTQPAQDNQVFTFTPSSGFGVSSFSLDNDGFQQNELPSARAFYLPPGHQSVSIDPVAGWNVVSSGCTNGSPVSDIAVQYRDVVTCTFTVEPVNPGSLTLILDTAPDDDTRFVFRVNGGSFYPGIALQDNGNEADGILKQHTVSASAYAHYTVSLFSTNPSGTSYRQVQATCSDGSPISDLNISPGENVTCTLVYAKPQSITVVQDTVPDDPQDFSYTTGAGLAPASFTLDDDGSDATDKPRSQTFSGLSPGTYSVSQVPANGNYQSASCSDGSSPASIDLSANEDVVCTFVNRPGGPGYPRPKAATPLMMPLVPAYEDCFVPNGVHAAPFSFGSCAPPTRTSSRLTIGTPDANAQPARSVSYLKLVRLVGDLRVIAHVDDVFSSSDLSDYTGELEARFSLKLTDKASQPLPTIATTQQFGLSVAIPCTATADTATGAACDLITDLNTLLPGAIVDGRRAMLETGPAEVYDGGADSDADTTAGNGLFMRQGVFVP